MAVVDDLQKLAAGDVVYLEYSLGGGGATPMVVYRGRLRQSLSGAWVFVASADQNGVVGVALGPVTDAWTSAESPAEGVRVQLATSISTGNGLLPVFVTLSTLIPQQFAD